MCIESAALKERQLIPFHLIESIQMKNIVMKEFLVTWSSNEGSGESRHRVAVETADRNDLLFQALNFLFQKTLIVQ